MKTVWVPTKGVIVVVKVTDKSIKEIDQSIAFEEKPVVRPGFSK